MGRQAGAKSCRQLTFKTKMASGKAAPALRQVKPLLSLDKHEARLRVLSLYKAWHRQLPNILNVRGTYESMPVTHKECRALIKSNFLKNAHVKDIRVIDMLVIKPQQDLRELIEGWAQSGHIMSKFFQETRTARPKDFMSKFLSGRE